MFLMKYDKYYIDITITSNGRVGTICTYYKEEKAQNYLLYHCDPKYV